MWLSIAFAVLLVVGAVIAFGHSRGTRPGDLSVSDAAPTTLVGLPANSRGIAQNSEWQTFATHVAAGSSSSFASVYGAYPPVTDPTTQTFFVVAAQPFGGTGDVDPLAAALIGKFRSEASQDPGAGVTYMSPRSSVEGGQIFCIGVSMPTGVQGECDWASGSSAVDVFTFSNDLPAVRRLTETIVSELKARPTSN